MFCRLRLVSKYFPYRASRRHLQEERYEFSVSPRGKPHIFTQPVDYEEVEKLIPPPPNLSKWSLSEPLRAQSFPNRKEPRPSTSYSTLPGPSRGKDTVLDGRTSAPALKFATRSLPERVPLQPSTRGADPTPPAPDFRKWGLNEPPWAPNSKPPLQTSIRNNYSERRGQWQQGSALPNSRHRMPDTHQRPSQSSHFRSHPPRTASPASQFRTRSIPLQPISMVDTQWQSQTPPPKASLTLDLQSPTHRKKVDKSNPTLLRNQKRVPHDLFPLSRPRIPQVEGTSSIPHSASEISSLSEDPLRSYESETHSLHTFFEITEATSEAMIDIKDMERSHRAHRARFQSRSSVFGKDTEGRNTAIQGQPHMRNARHIRRTEGVDQTWKVFKKPEKKVVKKAEKVKVDVFIPSVVSVGQLATLLGVRLGASFLFIVQSPMIDGEFI
jgi:hypothetical protein